MATILYTIAPDAFFQVNTAVAVQLVATVLQALALRGRTGVWNCTVGWASLQRPLPAPYVLGIEANTAAIADARINAERAGVADRVDLMATPVEHALRLPTVTQRQWDALLLDPPRAGVSSPAMTALRDLVPSKIVYVSCDAATLARDAQLLCANGYYLCYAQPLDMFPQTHHVETVALFARV
ncbi:MAG: hypothetical protein R3E79_41705 [Caldilineaceae bacterium]